MATKKVARRAPARRSALDPILDALEAATGWPAEPHGGYWLARCPAHDDRKPSLKVREGHARVFLDCLAGCGEPDVAEALGLERDALYHPTGATQPAPANATKSRWQARRKRAERVPDYRPWRFPDDHVECVHEYADAETGEFLFEQVRVKREFRERHKDAVCIPRHMPDGCWWRFGTGRPASEWPLYREREVREAIDAGRTVWIAEGERDVDSLAAAGCAATWACSGKWLDAQYDLLARARRLVVAMDADEAGAKKARDHVEALRPRGARVSVRAPATGKDASDHLAAGLRPRDMRAVSTRELRRAARRGEKSWR